MADTKRLWSALQTLLADNVSGDISPQDLRDAIYSLEPDYASMYVSSAAATTISVAGTYVKVQGTTTLKANNNFSMPLSNKLQYDGTPDRHVKAHVVGTFTPVGTAVDVSFRLAKNGTTDADTQQTVHAVTAVKHPFALVGELEDFATNDYVEVHVANDTDTNNLTVNLMVVFLETMFR